MWKIWKLVQQARCFFVKFNKRLFARVRRVASMVNEFCTLSPSQDSYIIRCVANYAVVHARNQSFLGHNVLFRAHRYNCYVTIRSVIGLVRSMFYLSHLCITQLTTTCATSPICYMSSSIYLLMYL